MTLRLRRLRVEVTTSGGLFGVDLEFPDGLTILQAANSSGKSLCVSAIAYALGLDLMFGPSGTFVLPHAVRTVLEDESGLPHEVRASRVVLDVIGEAGVAVRLTRSIVDRRVSQQLVEVRALSDVDATFRAGMVRGFYVGRPGAAQNERGFHHFLASLMGWQLPEVPRFDARSGPLYLEAVFPLLYIEQKRGWAGLQAHTPMFLRIRDVKRRAIEFLLGMDYFSRAARIASLEAEVERLRETWTATVREIEWLARRLGLRVLGLPGSLAAKWSREAISVVTYSKDSWVSLDDYLSGLEREINELRREVSVGYRRLAVREGELSVAEERLRELNGLTAVARARLEGEKSQMADAQVQLSYIREDLTRHRDLKSIRDLRGGSEELQQLHGECPTCGNQLRDAVLPVREGEELHSVEEMIALLEGQEALAKDVLADLQTTVGSLSTQVESYRGEISAVRRLIRGLREDLLTPDEIPSAVEVERRAYLEFRSGELQDFRDRLIVASEDLEGLGELFEARSAELRRLRSVLLSASDQQKLEALARTVVEQLELYRFSSLNPREVSLSEESYLPQHGGFELQVPARGGAVRLEADASASDGIRLIWAYVLGLLEISRDFETNHPGFVLLDEPRQQSTDVRDFAQLLARSAQSGSFGEQIILTTSEDLKSLQDLVRGIEAKVLSFPRRVLTRL